MEWHLQKTEHWEHLLPGEPAEFRTECPVAEDAEAISREEELSKEKHLDMPASWVQQLHIGNPGMYEIVLPPATFNKMSI